MGASLWIRCLQLLPYLEKYGVRSTVNQPDSEADIVIFVRSQDDAAYQMAVRQKSEGKKIIFDLCVNYFDETDHVINGEKVVTREHLENARRMVEVCDVVTCASNTIAQRARDFHSWVEYVPDSIDSKHFSSKKSLEDFDRPKIRAIWSGSAHKTYELEPILPLLKRRNVDLVIITNKPPRLRYSFWIWKRDFPYQFLRWQYEAFPRQILQGEFCISYRSVDTPYNRGHSLFKIGVFMAQGIPAIASPVPSYIEAVTATGAGKICTSYAEWDRSLEQIVEDRQILKTWSKHAYQIMENYSTEAVALKYIELFHNLSNSQ